MKKIIAICLSLALAISFSGCGHYKIVKIEESPVSTEVPTFTPKPTIKPTVKPSPTPKPTIPADYWKDTDDYYSELYNPDFTINNPVSDSGEQNNDSDKSVKKVDAPTTGERNALSAAKNYIDLIAMSHDRLVNQLEYDGYSHSEAVYGADNCGADWYKQAELAAANYLELMPFSRSRLIDQLEYDGFTHDQALYGVEQNGY